MAKSETHDKLIESVVDYKKGWTSLESAANELSEAAGLTPGIAAVFLKNMKRNNVTQIRGYEKTPEHIVKGRKGKSNEKKNF
tara:strand:+ start:233 stop:478 length:246 start_codon:yes stop_codon:yes gene_type:complete